MKLKKEQINAIFFHPDGRQIKLTEGSEMLADVYKVAPTLFESEAIEEKPKKAKK